MKSQNNAVNEMPQISRRPLTRFAGQCAVGVMLAAAAGLAQAQTYFRVDTGYAWGADAKAMDKSFATTPFICADPACTAPYRLDEVGSSWIAGLGVGYRWHDVFRTDVTFGWRGGFKLSDFDGRPFLYNSEISSYTLMLNGYIDVPLGGPSWFKPYVGAGVGASRNEIKEISAYGAAGVTGLPGHSNMDVAWQVSVGAGFQLNKSLILDVGYRYLDAGKFESGSGITTGALVVPYNGATGKLVTNELQVGLRF